MNNPSDPPTPQRTFLGWFGERPRRRTYLRISAALAAMVAAYFALRPSQTKAKVDADFTKLPTVAVTKVARANLSRDLDVQAEFRPYQEIDLHAKVAGYLEKILVDVGDRVEAGQLLAVLEIPELEADLQKAAATEKRSDEEVKRANAAYEEAHLIFSRLDAVNRAQPNLVAQQDLDAANAKDRAAAFALAAAKEQVQIAKADVQKLKTMLKYSKIVAPFSGVITKRYADPGALIQAGTSSSTQAMPLVRLSQMDRLRLVFPISMSYVTHVKVGDPVEITVQNADRKLSGAIARITRKLETATRTMDAEVDVTNLDLSLLPGIYATASLQMERRVSALAVPIQAVSRQGTPTVFLINGQHVIEERKVTPGLETPDKIEIRSGLSENELVMIGSRTQVKPGQKVEPKLLTGEKGTP